MDQKSTLNPVQLQLIVDGLTMLKVSTIRAIKNETDVGIRQARQVRADAIEALLVHVRSGK